MKTHTHPADTSWTLCHNTSAPFVAIANMIETIRTSEHATREGVISSIAVEAETIEAAQAECERLAELDGRSFFLNRYRTWPIVGGRLDGLRENARLT